VPADLGGMATLDAKIRLELEAAAFRVWSHTCSAAPTRRTSTS